MIDETTRLMDTRAYLDAVNAPAPIVERVIGLLGAYARLVDLRNSDVFVSDLIDPEGNRAFPSLWIFTYDAAFEARIPAEAGNQLDGTVIRQHIVHWVARTEDFEFGPAFPTSRAHVELWFSDGLLGELHATGDNCVRMTEILRKYVMPNTR